MAHEATMTTIEILKIREIMLDNPDCFVGVAKNIAQTVIKAITSMEVSQGNEFSDAFFILESLLANMNCQYSLSKPENFQFEFIALSTRMVKRLFIFIEASRTRN